MTPQDQRQQLFDTMKIRSNGDARQRFANYENEHRQYDTLNLIANFENLLKGEILKMEAV